MFGIDSEYSSKVDPEHINPPIRSGSPPMVEMMLEDWAVSYIWEESALKY